MSDEVKEPVKADETAKGLTKEEKAAREAGAAFLAKVADPVETGPITDSEQDKPKRVARGQVRIVYRGPADAVTHGEFTFRPGQPVDVPSDVAEDLQTLPFETFEEVKE